MIQHPCTVCGALKDVSPVPCDACRPKAETAERARIQAIADAAKCRPEDVTPALCWAHGLEVHEVTPETIVSPESRAAKSAHDEAITAALSPENALQIARAVRVEPSKARELLVSAVSSSVADALTKAAAVEGALS